MVTITQEHQIILLFNIFKIKIKYNLFDFSKMENLIVTPRLRVDGLFK